MNPSGFYVDPFLHCPQKMWYIKNKTATICHRTNHCDFLLGYPDSNQERQDQNL